MSYQVTIGTEITDTSNTTSQGQAYNAKRPDLCVGGNSPNGGGVQGGTWAINYGHLLTSTEYETGTVYGSLAAADTNARAFWAAIMAADQAICGFHDQNIYPSPQGGFDCSGSGITNSGTETIGTMLVSAYSYTDNPSLDTFFAAGTTNTYYVYTSSNTTLTFYKLVVGTGLVFNGTLAIDDTYLSFLQSLVGPSFTDIDTQDFVYFKHQPQYTGSTSDCGTLSGLEQCDSGSLRQNSISLLGSSSSTVSAPITDMPQIRFAIVGTASYTPPTPSPLPPPLGGADGSDPPHAPIGPPGDSAPYAPGFPIDYPDGYTGGVLPGLPAYKYLLRGNDVTSVLNGFFVQMSIVLGLYADQGDTSFLRQRQLDLNGNVVSNLVTATTGDMLVRLDQVHH
jgi:hypothetical protein